MATLALTAALGVALPAYAQVTDQTDQSEEDWRKSRKKSGTSDIYRTPNSSTTGVGLIDIKPLTPVERLPSDSRRHLMRERAKAIAESDDGDISDAEYVPSDAAKYDEQLMREEQEAWDVIVTDMKGSGGSGQGSGEGGPNKVAVAGQGNGTASTGSRGGSTRTLQEIMDAIKSGQTGGGGGASSGDGSSGSEQAGVTSSPDQAGPQSESGQTDDGANSDGKGRAQTDQSSHDAGAGDDAAADGNNGSVDGSGSGQSDSDSAADDAASASDAWPAATRAEEPLSPLERMRRTREDEPAEGSKRSASDYLGKPDG